MPRRILIIGNGFDLSLGLKTSYRDFLDWIKQNNLLQGNSLIDYLNSHQNMQGWVDVELAIGDYANHQHRQGDLARDQNSRLANVKAEFLATKEKLFEYLKAAVPNNVTLPPQSQAAQKIEGFINVLRESSEQGYVLNFNYTNTAIRLIEKYGNSSSLKHEFIHGNLEESNGILGVHDGYINNFNFPFLEKSASPMHDNFPLLTLLPSALTIDIFGHSLGATDSFYFKNYFQKIIRGECKHQHLSISAFDENAVDSLNTRIQTMTESNRSLVKGNLANFSINKL